MRRRRSEITLNNTLYIIGLPVQILHGGRAIIARGACNICTPLLYHLAVSMSTPENTSDKGGQNSGVVVGAAPLPSPLHEDPECQGRQWRRYLRPMRRPHRRGRGERRRAARPTLDILALSATLYQRAPHSKKNDILKSVCLYMVIAVKTPIFCTKCPFGAIFRRAPRGSQPP